ncbi:GNAT family N-acetyltransferase [Haloferax sp. MBLA0078]|uniref:GNAT family N-acetyltransferase n=2 Tax=Haloferacaceae TaxID=1644056 RepID=A0A6A8G3U6_9EURY|nr:GNAT family N-acetyltransferase [Haloferax sp. CBA1150]KAB1198882.1 GNAT family N-acetyltransferase [Haloferax sp. CBA1150]MRW95447.1 GNAT family N-acetyltransferase [Haloferax marinum]
MMLTEATEDDIGVLVEYWYDLASETERYSEFNELVYDGVDDVPKAGFETHFDSDDIADYLVEEADESIGFVTLRDGEHPSREYERYKSIVNLFIVEDYRNQGYGGAVVAAVKELAREDGCDHLKVSCEWENHDARRFYEDTDFEEKQVTFVQAIE